MPVEIVTLVEIKQRERALIKKAARMPANVERERILAEIELLRGLADVKRMLAKIHRAL